MAWEKRNGRSYYYRHKRIGDKVVKDYVGIGIHAELAAQQDLQKRMAKQEERAEIARIQRSLAPLMELMQELDQGVKMLCDASLLAADFHNHKGTWRKRRAKKKEND